MVPLIDNNRLVYNYMGFNVHFLLLNMQTKIETIKNQSKIGPKGFLNDVIGTENLKVWKKFFSKMFQI